MKNLFKLVALLAAIVITTSSVSAKVVSLGVAGGYYQANYSIDGLGVDIDNRPGFQLGVSAAFKVPLLSVTPEVWYNQSKASLSAVALLSSLDVDGVVDLDDDVISRSINVPIVVGLSILGPLTIEAGPSFMIYDKAKIGSYDLGHVNSSIGYVAGLKLTLLKKVMFGARFNGQFGGRESDFGGGTTYTIDNYSYSFSIGFKL